MAVLAARAPERWRTAAEEVRGNRLKRLYFLGNRSSTAAEQQAALLELCEALGSCCSLERFAVRSAALCGCMSALGEVLRSNTSLRELILRTGLGLTLRGAEALAEGLRGNASLRVLDLRGSLGPEGVPVLAKALWTKISLQPLHRLFDKRIGFNATIMVGEALLSKAALGELSLPHNSIGFEGAVALGQLLQHNTRLQRLDIAHNFVGDAGAIALGQALEIDGPLQELNLSFNGIGSKGAKALGQALQVNTTLQGLVLTKEVGLPGFEQNHIGEEGAVALTRALQLNSSLRMLKLSSQSFGQETRIALQQFGDRVVLL